MEDLGLFDLLSPYFLAGIDLGPAFHALLSTVHVDEIDCCFDESGVAVWGLARLDPAQVSGQLSFGPSGFSFSGSAQTGTSTQTAPPGSVWDWHDVTFQFRVTAPRSASPLIASAMQTLGGSVLTDLTPVFAAWGGTPQSATPTDYPNVQFELDLLLTVATVHVPLLIGAKLNSDGALVPDPANSDVRFVLPKILITLTQDGTIGQLDFVLDSWGAETIDDPDDTGEAQLLQMIPPYALTDDQGTFGFGFDKAILDHSDDHTPPELLSQYGVGDDWQGVYVPDLRIFVAPHGASGLAVDVSAHDLLIGLWQSHGVSGDFEIDVINQNTKPRLQVIFYDQSNTVISADQQQGYAAVALPQDCSMVVDVQGAVPPYTVVVDGTDITGTQTLVITNFNAAHDYQISVKDAKSQTAKLTVHAVPQATSGNPTPVPPPVSTDMVLSITSPNDGVHTITLVNPKLGTVQFAPYVPGIQVSVNGGSPQPLTSETLTVNVPAGTTQTISATWLGTASNSTVEVRGWFLFDRPPKPTYAQTVPPTLLVNTPTTPGIPAAGDVFPPPDPTDPTKPGPIQISDQEDQTTTDTPVPFTAPLVGSSDLNNFIANMADGQDTPFEIHGFASYEGTPKAQYNTDLSERRAIALAMAIAQAAQGTTKQPKITELPKGNNADDPALPGGVSAESAYGPNSGTPDSGYVPADYWMAHASYQATQTGPPATVTATLTGPPQTPPNPTPRPPIIVKPPGPEPNSQAWFRSIKVILRISQNTFIALEISGEIFIATGTQDQLQAAAQRASINAGGNPDITAKNLQPGNPNPDDGIVDYDLILSHDDSTNTWTEQLTIGAGKNDKDGLLRWGDPITDDSVTPTTDPWRNLLGSIIVFTPLLSEAAQAGSDIGGWKGGLLDVAALGAAGAIGAFGILNAETITLYGGELLAKEGSAGGEAAVFLDVEVDLYLDVLGLLTTKPSKPIKVRYKAVGVELIFQKGVTNPGMPIVFDASKGFSIDVTDPGTFHLPAGLDDIIQVLGARIARTNPLNLEVDLGIKADLGVVSVDRAKIRWPVSPVGVPTISALGATVDIPGAISGKGYLSVSDTGVAGSMDVTITSIGLRAQASLAIAKTPPDPNGDVATGVAISLEVDFPAPIILGDSGLGIYGFIALFAMHYARTIDDPMTWYQTANGDPTQVANPADWGPQYGHWDFGAGAILGTMDGGFVLNLKGVLILELPGPRLLLFMNANLLELPPLPELLNAKTGPILATLDLDFGRGTLSIGLQVNYNLSPLFEVSIPVDAFFDFTDPSDFQIDLGTIKKPVTVSVIDTFTGSGYLEIHGNGIPDFPLHPLGGFSLALGLDVNIIWGDTSINLYLEIGASASIGIGFSPFFLAGQLTISGQLHLFIISISASASLTVLSDGTPDNTSISGQICGSVSFFFFSVSACVGFTLGPSTVSVPPPDLVRELYLQSRSPALVQGTGVDRPIDASLGDATKDPGHAPTVPIDAIPVLKFAFTPQLDKAFTTFTKNPGNAPGVPPDGWNKRGDDFYRYTIQSITLGGPKLLNAAAGVPSVWRLNAPPGGDDRAIDLALMDWTPFATPRAVVSSTTLDSQVTHLWGTVCDQAAPPAPVFWDFERAKVGPSPTGWTLTGTAWPDPPDTVRSAPPPLQLTITELWRTGITLVDSLAAVEPAYVLAWPVPCISERLTAPQRTQLIAAHPEISSVRVQNALHRIDPGLTNFSRFVQTSKAPQVSQALRDVLGVSAEPGDSLKTIAQRYPESAALIGLAAEAVTPPARQWCEGRALVAPFAMNRLFFSNEFNRIPQAQSPLARANPDLTDALLFSGVPMTRVRLYLWVDTELIRYGSLTLRALDAQGHRLGDQIIRQRRVIAATDLPPEWIEPGGPWTNDALLAWELLYVYSDLHAQDHGMELLADLTLPAGTASFILGVDTHGASEGGLNDIQVPPAFIVAAVEGWSTAEEQRSSYDQTIQSQQLTTLQGALSGDPSTLPLFAPGQQYSITVNYTAESAPDDGHGHPDTSKVSSHAPTSQTLYFNTDKNFQVDDPAGGAPKPATLDPWVLCVWPGDDEAHHFYEDPITVVFSTNAIEQLVGAYGLTLQGNARAGTFQPPPSDPNSAKTKAPVFPLEAVQGNAMSPWQEAVNAAADQGVIPCVAGFGSTTTYGKQVFNVLLNPLTPYTFDIETNPPPALQTVSSYTPGDQPPAPVVPMYRTAFETSRYGALTDLIADVTGAKITYRHLTAGASSQLNALPAAPTDAALQTALNAAGLGVVPLARQPVVTVFWQDSSPSPIPAGVLLDMPEPLQRARQTPTPVYDPNPLHDPSRNNRIVAWQMQPQVWLDLVESSSGVAQTISVSTNGCRIYVSLVPNARGKTLGLALRRYQTVPIDAMDGHTDYPLLTVDLLQAPWEG
jgi:hypothetical protein